MDVFMLLKGILLGFSIAAPVGPIGILCIRRTLTEGRLVGFVSGLGAASADLIYGCVAAFGLAAVTESLVGVGRWLGLVGGLYLIYLGIHTFTSFPADQPARLASSGLLGAYFSTLALTLTNPMTILSFIAAFSALGLVQATSGYLNAGLLVLGVFCGSAGWWLLLSAGVGLMHSRVDLHWKTWINRIAGTLLIGFGGVALWVFFAG
jgi:threonine/homoserine/homoserine lactone efflux protein